MKPDPAPRLPLFDDPDPMHWPATRTEAEHRLKAFLPRAGRAYAATRNTDFGPGKRDNVSTLSPWIRHRLILEEDVLKAVLDRHAPSSAEKFIQEVYWRAYFKGWLEQRPQLWRRYQAERDAALRDLETDAALADAVEAATSGRTGIDCFDAWARELTETGYLHNHSRMWFASIWIFTLGLPWTLGADFFLRHLLDGDPASNTLGWRWVAGLHTRGKTYLARASNIARHTDGRFNPSGQLATTAPALHDDGPGPVMGMPTGAGMPQSGKLGLIVTEEDCSPEKLDWPVPPQAAIGLIATEARSPRPVGAPALAFASAAINDALKRSATAFGIETETASSDDWGALLVNWAGRNQVNTLVTPYAPVGPVADRLAAAEPALKEAGIPLVRVLRPYDAAAWPHATKGFFALKARIPELLKRVS
ncbi:MAG: FAD-binding domain-containing protein [Pseudomonadota bacterium]